MSVTERAQAHVQLEEEAVLFAKKAVVFASDIARCPAHCNNYGSIHDLYIDVLHKAGEYKTMEQNQFHQRELEKRQYSLRRALVEFNQIVKDNGGLPGTKMESHVEDELGGAFVELVEFMSKIMEIKHDDFVTGVHEAVRVKDYSLILDQLDANIHVKFKRNQVVGCFEIAKIASDLTGIPASWFVTQEINMRCIRLKQQLQKRVFEQTTAIDTILEVLYKQTGWQRWAGTPLGMILCNGSNRVGKAELARAFARELYYDEDRVVRIDLAKYAEADSVPSLADTIYRIVKSRPCCVLVLDRIDLAHSRVRDTLFSVVEGAVDGIGFQDTLIIITSEVDNVYAQHMMEFTMSVDDGINVCWSSDLKDCCRILLREWAFERSTIVEGCGRGVIICPSKAALIEMEKRSGATVEGLESWMDEKVFPVLSKMVSGYDGVAQNIIVYIDKQDEETGELSFTFQ